MASISSRRITDFADSDFGAACSVYLHDNGRKALESAERRSLFAKRPQHAPRLLKCSVLAGVAGLFDRILLAVDAILKPVRIPHGCYVLGIHGRTLGSANVLRDEMHACDLKSIAIKVGERNERLCSSNTLLVFLVLLFLLLNINLKLKVVRSSLTGHLVPSAFVTHCTLHNVTLTIY